jgi:hypothetical protein
MCCIFLELYLLYVAWAMAFAGLHSTGGEGQGSTAAGTKGDICLPGTQPFTKQASIYSRWHRARGPVLPSLLAQHDT